MYTTQKQRDEIQEFIQVELLKRGFHAKITSFKEAEGRNGKNYLEFQTETFQTTPVIFKSVRINNFSSSISDVIDKMFRRVWVQVHVSYEHFDRGSNGCCLFDLFCETSIENDRVTNFVIK